MAIGKSELISVLSEKCGLTKAKSGEVIETLISEIQLAVAAESVACAVLIATYDYFVWQDSIKSAFGIGLIAGATVLIALAALMKATIAFEKNLVSPSKTDYSPFPPIAR